MQASSQSSESAKEFLVSKLLEQAQRDRVSLSDIEKRMFLFSETSEAPPDREAAEKFEAECDESAYEARIAKLLRRAYARDKKTPEKNRWQESLNALEEKDFYGLVMVDQAGIPRSVPGIWSITLREVLMGLVLLVVVALGTFVVFQPARLHLTLPDWLRLVLFAVFAGIVWLVGKFIADMDEKASLRRSHSKQL